MTAVIPAAPPTGLLAGPSSEEGAETHAGHVARLGDLSPAARGEELLDVLEDARVIGRGGGAFPAAVKWRAVAERSRGRAVVVGNGMEGEPASIKDRLLLVLRPHLVLDGLVLAAEAVGASRAILAVPRSSGDVLRALSDALAQRPRSPVHITVAGGPRRFVAGEETALVRYLNGGPARPTVRPPRPYERGVEGRPTLVHNVETLAQIGLVARFGADWFRSLGRAPHAGSSLVTVTGAVVRGGVVEIANGTTVGEAVTAAGGATEAPAAVLAGGYFGRWLTADAAWPMRLGVDVSVGAGVLAVLPQGCCGIAEVARIARLLAGESARQCGPCEHGLDAIAGGLEAIAAGRAGESSAERLVRWCSEVTGRGACAHPDGATLFVRSALTTFASDVSRHVRRGACAGAHRGPLLPTPDTERGWR